MSDTSTTKGLKASQQLYIEGDFDQAIEKTLESKDELDQGLFHYNLGSLYLKKGSYGPARYHLEKAKKSDFSYPMLWNNLSFLNSQREVLDPTKSPFLKEKLIGHYMDLPSVLLTVVVALSLATTLLAIRFRRLKNYWLAALLIIVSVSPWAVRLALDRNYKFAVVIKGARVFEGPSKIFQDFGQIPEGSRVIVGKYHDKWYYILSPSDFSGWVEKSTLGFY